MDYTTLVADRDTDGSLKSWINATDIPSTTILEEAQAHIYQNLRVREMLTNGSGTISQGDEAIPLSSFTNYRQGHRLQIIGTTVDVAKSKLVRWPLDQVLDARSWDADGNRVQARPQWWATDASNIVLDSAADQDYPYEFWYYQALQSLSGSNLTNFLTDKYPAMLRYACLMKANEWKKDHRERVYYGQLVMGEITSAHVDSDREQETSDIVIMVE